MGAVLASVREPEAPERALLEQQFELRCEAAARALAGADVLLLCTGAGFSADSGLAVYADIAGVPAYRALGLKYHDICRPHWLWRDPELFYGFWGACYNDYRKTQPHEGYGIVGRWRDARFRESEVALEIQARAARARGGRFGPPGADGRHETEPHRVRGIAGAFFVFTSNVDGHSFDFFDAHEVRECHGNTEVWQCGAREGPCCQRAWRAPVDFAFAVDKDTMRVAARSASEAGVAASDCKDTCTQDAINVSAPANGAAVTEEEGRFEDAAGGGPAAADRRAAPGGPGASEPARAGQSRLAFGRRRQALAKLPPPDEGDAPAFGGGGNWPRCPFCGSLARPAILMFGDAHWVDNKAQDARWEAWLEAAMATASEMHASGRRLRALILEIGCGGNVRTVRNVTESTAEQFIASKAEVTVARVNLDFPFADSRPSSPRHRHLGILSGGLRALQTIDAALQSLPPGDASEAWGAFTWEEPAGANPGSPEPASPMAWLRHDEDDDQDLAPEAAGHQGASPGSPVGVGCDDASPQSPAACKLGEGGIGPPAGAQWGALWVATQLAQLGQRRGACGQADKAAHVDEAQREGRPPADDSRGREPCAGARGPAEAQTGPPPVGPGPAGEPRPEEGPPPPPSNLGGRSPERGAGGATPSSEAKPKQPLAKRPRCTEEAATPAVPPE